MGRFPLDGQESVHSPDPCHGYSMDNEAVKGRKQHQCQRSGHRVYLGVNIVSNGSSPLCADVAL